jgi:hypothetical protein
MKILLGDLYAKLRRGDILSQYAGKRIHMTLLIKKVGAVNFATPKI